MFLNTSKDQYNFTIYINRENLKKGKKKKNFF